MPLGRVPSYAAVQRSTTSTPHVPKVPDIARCHRHATGAGDRRALAVRRCDVAAGGTAGRGDLRIFVRGVTVERQDSTLEVLPQGRLDGQGQGIPALARWQDRDPRSATPPRRPPRNAVPPPGAPRPSAQPPGPATDAAVRTPRWCPAARSSHDAQSKVGGSRAGSRGGSARSTPPSGAIRARMASARLREPGLCPTASRRISRASLFHRAAVARRPHVQARLHVLVEVADRDARQDRACQSLLRPILSAIAMQSATSRSNAPRAARILRNPRDAG